MHTHIAETERGQMWVFLSGGQMCLAQANFGSVSCVREEEAKSEGVVLGTFKPPTKRTPYLHQFQLLGVLPDGVRHVIVTKGRGHHKKQVRVPVRNNVFAFAAEQPIVVSGTSRS